MIKSGVDSSLAFVRRTEPDAAADIDALRRREITRPSFAVVGETKRGKSSLVNALIGVPNLSPVDAAVATAAYLEFSHSATHGARAYVPGKEQPEPLSLGDLRDWGTLLGRLPEGVRPPRRIEVLHSAPLLRYLTLVDTPGVGGAVLPGEAAGQLDHALAQGLAPVVILKDAGHAVAPAVEHGQGVIDHDPPVGPDAVAVEGGLGEAALAQPEVTRAVE